ncbi:Protein MioC [Vibrio stylophorae]|uniref:Protein MioC n=1 Tax=Vibrio stylophorae TaxID=659351 RepID=A0ABN8DY52_9VIBR|nr:FMN-binding protein MioC [Vibrio stylophorae]CAH0534778.1 Protein MioC [Vibrio stylophorae]
MSEIQVLTGSTLGGTEYLGEHIADQLAAAGFAQTIHFQADLDQLPTQGPWILACSTHGAGDYPESIQSFVAQLESSQPDLSQVHMALVAVGDRSYDTFCQAGKNLEKLLQSLGAKLIYPRLEIDVSHNPDLEEQADEWLPGLIEQLKTVK